MLLLLVIIIIAPKLWGITITVLVVGCVLFVSYTDREMVPHLYVKYPLRVTAKLECFRLEDITFKLE